MPGTCCGPVSFQSHAWPPPRYSLKSLPARSGKPRGGQSFSRGALYLILQNQVYRGQIPHRDAYYPGKHEAIIEQGLWDDVQALLESNREARHLGQRARTASLLAGLVFDETARRLTPSHTRKGGKRYRYYISRVASPSSSQLPQLPISVPAHDLERLVLEQVESLLKSSDLDRQLLNSEIEMHMKSRLSCERVRGLASSGKT